MPKTKKIEIIAQITNQLLKPFNKKKGKKETVQPKKKKKIIKKNEQKNK